MSAEQATVGPQPAYSARSVPAGPRRCARSAASTPPTPTPPAWHCTCRPRRAPRTRPLFYSARLLNPSWKARTGTMYHLALTLTWHTWKTLAGRRGGGRRQRRAWGTPGGAP
jgi:hypothetical protein